jgi:hypothetical protein
MPFHRSSCNCLHLKLSFLCYFFRPPHNCVICIHILNILVGLVLFTSTKKLWTPVMDQESLIMWYVHSGLSRLNLGYFIRPEKHSFVFWLKQIVWLFFSYISKNSTRAYNQARNRTCPFCWGTTEFIKTNIVYWRCFISRNIASAVSVLQWSSLTLNSTPTPRAHTSALLSVTK